MSTGAPFDAIHPYELGGRGATLRARLATTSFERLCPLLRGSDGEFATRLCFELDDRGRCIVTGEIAGRVRLLCQGCAVEVPYDIDRQLRTVLVRTDDEARELMPANDVLVVSEDVLALVDLLEDELILNLPEVVCGDLANCPNRPAMRFGGAEPQSSPFSGLADLLGRRGSDESG